LILLLLPSEHITCARAEHHSGRISEVNLPRSPGRLRQACDRPDWGGTGAAGRGRAQAPLRTSRAALIVGASR
jgi:hypothetical protein